MIMSSTFDQQRMESPPVLTSSGAGTPTPTSSSNSVPQPQVPSVIQRGSGPTSWIKQQIQAMGGHPLPSGPSSMHSHPKGNGMANGSHHTDVLTSQAANCNNEINQGARIRGESPDEGIQVESDV